MSDEDFYEGMFANNPSSAGIDSYFQERDLAGDYFKSVQDLVGKEAGEGRLTVLDLPLEVGTRVAFIGDLDSMLTYPDYPSDKLGGSVVRIRSANGESTHSNSHVHVLWDDGKFRPILASHMLLEPATTRKHAKTGDPVRIVTSSLGDISTLFVRTMRANELVHKATNDMWSFRQEGSQYVIERLFNSNGAPLKEG